MGAYGGSYTSFVLAELLTTPGVEERFVAGSPVGVCALHGGLEQGTAEIAAAVANASGSSFYAVVQPDDLRWHIPSHQYNVEASDSLSAFLAHVELVISVHGFGGLRGADDRWVTSLLGGTNRALADETADALRRSLPQYHWITDMNVIPAHLRGMHPRNPVNIAPGGGVQIELPPRVRRAGDDYNALVTTLAAVATSARRRCTGGG